ncbi:MAG: glycosyltransferase [Synechococcales cyanobacterium RM1_1_8]|nr:glycosyltransferase [Synechococcales cyanobacterium RM1_1_8]
MVFLDNDVRVEPGWLEQLVATAEQEQADVVVPLLLEDNGSGQMHQLHSAGLRLKQTTLEDGRCCLQQSQRRYCWPESGAEPRCMVVRGIESHCFLMRATLLEDIQFDPLLDEPLGELDLNLQLQQQARRLVMEPAAQATFLNPQLDPSFEPMDLPLYCFRWGDRALQETCAYLIRKWNLCAHSSGLEHIRRQAIAHRQLPLYRTATAPWKLLLKGSKLSGCPLWLRSCLESHLHRKPIRLAPAATPDYHC